MINKEATIRWKGYNPDDLKSNSSKRVWVICNKCQKGRWIRLCDSDNNLDLCFSCAIKQKAIDDPTFLKRRGKKISLAFTEERKNEYRKRMISSNKNLEQRQKQSTFMKKNNPMDYPIIRQKHLEICRDLNRCEEISNRNKERIISDEERQHVSAGKQGIPYNEWEAFACEQKYCPAFDEKCRESNREKYDRKCFLCEMTEKNNGRKLAVHHVDMNKQQGCNKIRWKLVPLCNQHHGKSHTELWEARITWLLINVW